MSAPLKLAATDLEEVASFLTQITEASQETGVHLGAYDRSTISINDNVLHISWDDAEERYVIDDRVGD